MSDKKRLSRAGLADLFAVGPCPVELVGVEVEHGLVDPATGLCVPYPAARRLLKAFVDEFDGAHFFDGEFPVGVDLPDGASLSLETGGALEYASAPHATLSATVEQTRSDLQRAARVAAGHGIALLSGGNIPFAARADISWIPKPRVDIMRRYFRSLGADGAYADEVMGLTLSTQTSLDYVSEADLLEKLRLHVLAAPAVSALFVNSPIAEGVETGALSRRMQYWRQFEPGRCGVIAAGSRAGCTVSDLVDWAAQLPMIYRSAGGTHVPAPAVPFAAVVDEGFGDGTWPTLDDWALHLSQTWPHVRVRRTIEARACDGLPWPFFAAAPAMWVGLTYDAQARRAAIALLESLTADQLERATDEVAAKGLAAAIGPFSACDLARELLRLARGGLAARVAAGTEPPGVLSYLDPLERICDSFQTMAEQTLSRWQGGLAGSPQAYVAEFRVPA
ncbi:MAG TPA: glutamate-cysteine ligase family protein [Asanoa sp.]|nr:glutamate-cysteine ligase family protein [Asanoa sp.]